MNKFYPERLSVEYRNGINGLQSVNLRRYTLTHSDDTGKLFLTIGNDYAWDKVNQKLRDEVLGEWRIYRGYPYFYVYLYIDQGEYDLNTSAKRNDIFKRELPLALKAIRYGDKTLFERYPMLDNAFIIVNFISTYSQFAKQENWGSFSRFAQET